MSSDSAITAPFQVAVVIPVPNAPGGRPTSRSPTQRVHLPGSGGPAGAAVSPGHDAQRARGLAALGALDGLLRMGARLLDLLGPFLVDLLVAPAGAAQVGFGASSRPVSDGVPPAESSCQP